MTVVDTWDDWETNPALDTPPSTATPEIDKELRNIKAQVKKNCNLQVAMIGGQGYETLATALTTIGSDPATLVLPPGATTLAANTTIPANITVDASRMGSYFECTTYDLTIQGPIIKGPDTLFTWTTGTIDVSGSPTCPFLFDWWGPTFSSSGSFSGDNEAALTKACASLGSGQTLKIRNGIYRFATAFTYAGNRNGINIEGENQDYTLIYVDVGSSNDCWSIGDETGSLYNMRVNNINFIGPAACCKSALVFNYWNGNSGAKNITFALGSVDYACKLLGVENCDWDFRFNQFGAYTAAGLTSYGRPAKGIYGGPNLAGYGGTYNKIRILKSGYTACSDGLYLDRAWSWIVEEGNLEDCQTSADPYYNGSWNADKAKFTASVTKLAQVYTLASQTTISEVAVYLDQVLNPKGMVTASLYATSAGAPTGAAVATSQSIPSAKLNNSPFPYIFRFPNVVQAAGQYAIVVNFARADANSYVEAAVKNGGTYAGGGGYYYDGSWHASSWIMGFALNPGAGLTLDGCLDVVVKHQYFESGYRDILIKNSYQIDIKHQNALNVDLQNSHSIRLVNGTYNFLYIDPFCYGIVVDNITVSGMIEDYGDTQYLGAALDWVTYRTTQNILGNNYNNHVPNSLFNRWQSGTVLPWGWINGIHTTWAQEATIVHRAKYSAKLVTTADDDIYLSLQPDIFNAIRGNYATFSVWTYFPAGQTWANNASAAYIQAYPTIPSRADNTAYQIGDAIYDGANYQWICVVAGTSDSSPPTFPLTATQGVTAVVDGGILWKMMDFARQTGGYLDTASSGAGWQKVSYTSYVPRNATAYGPHLHIYKQSGGNTTLYLAEPTLAIGSIPAKGVLPAANDTGMYFFVNGVAIMADSVVPSDAGSIYYTNYHNAGDVCFEIGGDGLSRCTVAGTPGTWSAF